MHVGRQGAKVGGRMALFYIHHMIHVNYMTAIKTLPVRNIVIIIIIIIISLDGTT